MNHHLETPRCSLEIMLRYSCAFGFTGHCSWKISGYVRKHRRYLQWFQLICAKLRYTKIISIEKSFGCLFVSNTCTFQIRISRHSLTSSCQIYPCFVVTWPAQTWAFSSRPRPHTKPWERGCFLMNMVRNFVFFFLRSVSALLKVVGYLQELRFPELEVCHVVFFFTFPLVRILFSFFLYSASSCSQYMKFFLV
jgi:hypothetical protein